MTASRELAEESTVSVRASSYELRKFVLGVRVAGAEYPPRTEVWPSAGGRDPRGQLAPG
jgi:hypothetical protein